MITRLRAWDKTTNQMRGCYGFNELEREVYVCSVADDEFNGRLRTVHALKRGFDEVAVNLMSYRTASGIKKLYPELRMINKMTGREVM